MRLTHAITMHAENRATLEATVVPDSVLAVTLEQTDLDGEHLSSSVYLSFDQYDVLAELVDRVRPELPEGGQVHHIPEVSYAICEHTGQYGRCVMAHVGNHRHINAGGRDVDTGQAL